jgi:hypothetical protein
MVSVQVVVAGVVAKTTVPLGTAVPAVNGGVTVAVAVTFPLTAAGLGEDTTTVVGRALLTTWGTVFEVPPAKFESPL